MKATLLLRDRVLLKTDLRVELVLWKVPTPVSGSTHSFKYRLALIDRDICVLRYDNEAGKGDHKHIDDREMPYSFSTIETLRKDFLKMLRHTVRGENDEYSNHRYFKSGTSDEPL